MSNTQAKLDELTKHRDDTDKRIAELKAKLAEESKPKLGNFDYGVDSTGQPFIMTSQISQDKVFYGDGSGQLHPQEYCSGHVIYGNLDDDLKAMQDDVTEFEVKCTRDGTTKVIFDSIGESENSFRIIIRDKYGCYQRARVNFDVIPKLRQMEAQLRRQK